jgi:hypothetical protein
MTNIYETDSLDEAIDIVQDENKVITRHGIRLLMILSFSDIHLFSINSILVPVKKNGRAII